VSFQPETVRGIIPRASSRLCAFALYKPWSEVRARRSLAPPVWCLGALVVHRICFHPCPSVVKILMSGTATRCIPAGYRCFPPLFAMFPGHNPLYSRRLRHFPPVFVFFYFGNQDPTEGNEGGLNQLIPAGNPDKPAYKWLARKARTGSTRLNPDKGASVFFRKSSRVVENMSFQPESVWGMYVKGIIPRPSLRLCASALKKSPSSAAACHRAPSACHHLTTRESSACRRVAPLIAASRRLATDKIFLPVSRSWRLCALALNIPRSEVRARRSLAPPARCLSGESICVDRCPSVVKSFSSGNIRNGVCVNLVFTKTRIRNILDTVSDRSRGEAQPGGPRVRAKGTADGRKMIL
jgi:hypothetical protein